MIISLAVSEILVLITKIMAVGLGWQIKIAAIYVWLYVAGDIWVEIGFCMHVIPSWTRCLIYLYLLVFLQIATESLKLFVRK